MKLLYIIMIGLFLISFSSAWSTNHLTYLESNGLTDSNLLLDETCGSSGSGYWFGQNFSTEKTITLDKVLLKLYRINNPGNIFIKIRPIDGTGSPNSTILVSTTYDANSITDNTNGEWINIDVTNYTLTQDVGYFLEITGGSTCSSSDQVGIFGTRFDTYPKGELFSTNDAGATWNIIGGGYDITFALDGKTNTEENLTFTGDENITRWLMVPENTFLANAFINYSGYSNGTREQEDATAYTTDHSSGNFYHDTYVYDNDWNTGGYVTSGTSGTIYFNYTKPYYATKTGSYLKVKDSWGIR